MLDGFSNFFPVLRHIRSASSEINRIFDQEHKKSQNFNAPLFLFGLKEEEVNRCFDAIEICSAGRPFQSVEIYIGDFDDYANFSSYAPRQVHNISGVALVGVPDDFAQDPVLWLAFNLSVLATFPGLVVIPVLPKYPSESAFSFASYCPAKLYFNSTAEDYAKAISLIARPMELDCCDWSSSGKMHVLDAM